MLALAFGASVLGAQDKKEPTSAEKMMDAIHKGCCKAEKCEGEQKKTCDQVAASVKAGLAKFGEKAKKEGIKCEECAKAKDGGPCTGCSDMVVKVVVPYLKSQAEAKDATHTLGQGDKKETIKCSLLKGPACKGCAEEMSDAILKACKDAAKK
jgi:hypothetical protein